MSDCRCHKIDYINTAGNTRTLKLGCFDHEVTDRDDWTEEDWEALANHTMKTSARLAEEARQDVAEIMQAILADPIATKKYMEDFMEAPLSAHPETKPPTTQQPSKMRNLSDFEDPNTIIEWKSSVNAGRAVAGQARKGMAYLRQNAETFRVEEVKSFLSVAFYFTYKGPAGPAQEFSDWMNRNAS